MLSEREIRPYIWGSLTKLCIYESITPKILDFNLPDLFTPVYITHSFFKDRNLDAKEDLILRIQRFEC